MKTWSTSGGALTAEILEEAFKHAELMAGINYVTRGNPLPSTLEDWCESPELLTEENIAKYPAAKKAHKLINSKLYKALK